MAIFKGNGGVNSPYEFDTFQMLVDLMTALSGNYASILPEENQPPEPGNVIYIDMSMVPNGDNPDNSTPRTIDLNDEFDDYLVQTMTVPNDKWTIYLNLNGGTITNICVGPDQTFFTCYSDTYVFTIFNGSFLNVYASGGKFFLGYRSTDHKQTMYLNKCAVSINAEGFNRAPFQKVRMLNTSINMVTNKVPSTSTGSYSYPMVFWFDKWKPDNTVPAIDGCDILIKLNDADMLDSQSSLFYMPGANPSVLINSSRIRAYFHKQSKDKLLINTYDRYFLWTNNYQRIDGCVIELDMSECEWNKTTSAKQAPLATSGSTSFVNTIVSFKEPKQSTEEGAALVTVNYKGATPMNETTIRSIEDVTGSGFTVIPVE